jgi:hypothetical protein
LDLLELEWKKKKEGGVQYVLHDLEAEFETKQPDIGTGFQRTPILFVGERCDLITVYNKRAFLFVFFSLPYEMVYWIRYQGWIHNHNSVLSKKNNNENLKKKTWF